MIIENQSSYDHLINDIKNSDYIILPILLDKNRHAKNNSISCIYIYVIKSKIDYLIVFNHNDKLFDIDIKTFFTQINNDCNKYTLDKKILNHFYIFNNVIDINLLYYLAEHNTINTENILTNSHTYFFNKYHSISDVNKLVPLMKHLEYGTNFTSECKKILIKNMDFTKTTIFRFYNNIVICNLFEIEKNGLYSNFEIVNELFPDKYKYHDNDKKLLYSNYNLYTSTGRPSNTNNGINLAALNKTNGSRSIIKSRFNNGVLLEFDYVAYHPNIIMNMIDYKIPGDISVYEYLGRFFFGKDILTPEELNESKQITFRLLYGGIEPAFENIDLLKQINKLIHSLWSTMKKQGYIESLLTKRKIKLCNIDTPSVYKLWNYYIQLLETEQSMYNMYNLLKYLKPLKSKLILYTYDSFLIDFNKLDGKESIHKIKEILENNNQFKCSVSYGHSYDKMIKIVNI